MTESTPTDRTILYPGQCCPGYCVGDLLHDLRSDQAERLVEVLAQHDAEVKAEHRMDWAGWISDHGAYVGTTELTQAEIVEALVSGVVPFGVYAAKNGPATATEES